MKFPLLIGLAGSLMVGAGWVNLAVAGVVPDATLPQPSRVTSTGRRSAITAGTRRGRNLFHSFREFSVGSRETASFQGIDSDIANIFARVTGSNPSRINGMIEVLQSNNQISAANLFLLNPNGIIFGKNASLRIGGSFIATTADSINFADGTQFSAINPQTSPLLTVSVPTGLQFGNNPRRIVNRSTAPLLDEAGNPVNDALGYPISGLVGSTNQTFALVGGDVTFPQGQVLVDSGRIEIGSVGSNSQVTLTSVALGWDLSYENVENFGDIQLISAAVDGTGSVGSAIQIQGRQVALQRNSLVFTASANSSQTGGAIEATATDSIVVEQRSLLSTVTDTFGRSGNIVVSTPQLNIRSGGRIGSSTYSEGRGGNVRINASESVTVAGLALDSFNPSSSLLSLIYAQSEDTGPSGSVTIETDRLQVRSGGQISTTAFSSGDAGALTIRANTVELAGTALDANGRPIFSDEGLPLSGGLFVSADIDSSGDGGRLTVETERLSLRDGSILQATTYGTGDAGNIVIRATDSVEVSGTSQQDNLPARIAATSGGIREFSTPQSRRATGSGGNLSITTDRLTVEDGGIVTVNSLNPDAAGAGTIRIQANQILLNNQGQLNAQTESGDQAGIQLEGVELLTMRRNSNISTSAGKNSDSGGGNGGDINIDADLILNAPAEDSDIDADAGNGNGGNIDINAQGILGIAERTERTFQSDITATSESGVNGEINISTPTIDPTRGIVELPSTVVDASQLIAQGCRAGNRAVTEELGEFVITGRGGLPPSPTDLRNSDAVVTPWATLEPPNSLENQSHESEQSNAVSAETNHLENRPINRPIIEAQGWVVGENGKVNLVAQAPIVTPAAPNWNLPNCTSQSLPTEVLTSTHYESAPYETIEHGVNHER